LEDPSHSAADQPRFEAKLLDQNGQVIPCTNYYVSAGPGSGFQNCGGIQYKPWITIGVDVSAYVGQTVTLDFATGDCGQGAHFGYAYVDAGCAPFLIDSRYCEVQNGLNIAVLTAPPGFQSYLWSNGGTNNTTVIVNPQQGEVITCQITSVNGCVANLQATMTPSDVTTSYIPESACAGDTINLVNTSVYENATEDSVSWTSSDGYSSNTTDFSHVYTTPGSYQVELFVQSDAGCRDSVTQNITVYENPVSSILLTDICLGDQAQIASTATISNNSPLTSTWLIEGNTLTGSPITYDFSSVDTVLITLVSQSQNNCSDSVQQQIIIYDNPIADFTFLEQCANVPVDFTNTSTFLSSQNLYSWIYNSSEVATTIDYSSLFSNSGNNTLTLIVQDVYPTVTCDDTITQSFFVHDLVETPLNVKI
jgi:plastocyanin